MRRLKHQMRKRWRIVSKRSLNEPMLTPPDLQLRENTPRYGHKWQRQCVTCRPYRAAVREYAQPTAQNCRVAADLRHRHQRVARKSKDAPQAGRPVASASPTVLRGGVGILSEQVAHGHGIAALIAFASAVNCATGTGGSLRPDTWILKSSSMLHADTMLDAARYCCTSVILFARLSPGPTPVTAVSRAETI